MNARRFDITAKEIDVVVARFYAEIRHHPVLGPVFARHVTDWPKHESKIVSFWRNAILREQGYDGNPMLVHKEAGDIRAEMFPIWLELFDTVLSANLTINQARNWSALAHRIGKGLSYGLAQAGDPQTSAADREVAFSSAKPSTMPEPFSERRLSSKIPFPLSTRRRDSPLPA